VSSDEDDDLSAGVKDLVSRLQTVIADAVKKNPWKEETRTCHRCKVKGHLARDCPENEQDSKNESERSEKKGQLTSPKRTNQS
jgi:hypothetical protein